MRPILSILCDFDGVLCNLDFPKACAMIDLRRSSLRISPEKLLRNYFFSNPLFLEIDAGRISYNEMLRQIMSDCWTGNLTDWFDLWSDIWSCYVTDEYMLRTLAIAAKCGISVRIVTDNHLLFRDWFVSRPEFAAFQGSLICSAEVRSCKPSIRFFEAALTSAGCEPGVACLIDDNINNVEGAIKLGMKAIHHVNSFGTISTLAMLTGLNLSKEMLWQY